MSKNEFLIGKIILLLVIVLALVIAQEHKILAQSPDASLTFSETQKTILVGEEFSVGLYLDPKGASIDAVDVSINYPEVLLKVLSVSSNPTTQFKTLAPLVSDSCSFGLNQAVWEPGKLKFGLLAYDCPSQGTLSPHTGVLGAGNPLATITFKAKSAGTGDISFDFTPGNTTDTNVVEHGTAKDILTAVNSLSLTVISECDENKSNCDLEACQDKLCNGGSCWNVGGEVSATTCCGDDKGEYYGYFDQYEPDGCDDITNNNCAGKNDDPSDDACCKGNRCVFNSKCYAHGEYADLNGDGVSGELCLVGRWYDPDRDKFACLGYTKLGQICVDNLCWIQGGESSQFGEYNTGTSTECCGDDKGENYIAADDPKNAFGQARCCANGHNFVDKEGDCVTRRCEDSDATWDIPNGLNYFTYGEFPWIGQRKPADRCNVPEKGYDRPDLDIVNVSYPGLDLNEAGPNNIILASSSKSDLYYAPSAVLRRGSEYKMWYLDNSNRIRYTTSNDGIHWDQGKQYVKNMDGTDFRGDIQTRPGFAGNAIVSPRVRFEDGKYKMWYGVEENYDGQATIHLAYAESYDGIYWQKYSANPIIQDMTEGHWAAVDATCFSLAKVKNQYELWYVKKDDKLYKAVSSNGLNWRLGEKAVFSNIDDVGTVFYQQGVYQMWFIREDSIYYTTSLNGEDWSTPHTLVIPPAEPVKSWYKPSAFSPFVLEDTQGYNVYYVRIPNAGDAWTGTRIAYARANHTNSLKEVYCEERSGNPLQQDYTCKLTSLCIRGRCIQEGDLNEDMSVNTKDKDLLINFKNWGKSPENPRADFNNDGVVNGADILKMKQMLRE